MSAHIRVDDTCFRVTCDGTEISLHPRNERHPVEGQDPRHENVTASKIS